MKEVCVFVIMNIFPGPAMTGNQVLYTTKQWVSDDRSEQGLRILTLATFVLFHESIFQLLKFHFCWYK